MRFYHTADFHLGYQPDKDLPWGAQRSAAIAKSLACIVDLCNKEDVDLLLIAGNLFDHPPVLDECRAVDAYFQALQRTKVVLVAGPRDFLRPGSTFASYPFAKNVRFLANDSLSSVYFPQWNLEVYGVSYIARTHPEGLPAGFALPDDGRTHLLLASGGEGDCFPLPSASLTRQGWDYVALGGRRSPSISSDGRVAYPGTPEPLGRGEPGQHGCFAGALENGQLNLYWKPISTAEYTNLTIHVSPTTTQEGLEKLIHRRARQDSREILSINLVGERRADLHFDLPAFKRQGAIAHVEDNTLPVPVSLAEEPAAAKRLKLACRDDAENITDPIALREGLAAIYAAAQSMQEPAAPEIQEPAAPEAWQAFSSSEPDRPAPSEQPAAPSEQQLAYDLAARATALLDLRIREEESRLRPHAQVTAAAMRSELELLERQQLSDEIPRLDALSKESAEASATLEAAEEASLTAADAYERRRKVLESMGIDSRDSVASDAESAEYLAKYLKIYENDYAAGASHRTRTGILAFLSAAGTIIAFLRGTLFVNDYNYLAAGICLFIALALAIVYVRLSRETDAHGYAKKNRAVLERLLSRYVPDYEPRGTSREALQLKEFLGKILEIYDYLGDYRTDAEEKAAALEEARSRAASLKAQLEMQCIYIADREQWEARVKECMEALDGALEQIETNKAVTQTVQSLRRAKRVLAQDLQ